MRNFWPDSWVEETGERRPEKFFSYDFKTTEETNPGTYGLGTQYRNLLKVQFVVEFWANSAQKDKAQKEAMKYALNRISAPVMQYLIPLRHAILNDDKDTALQLCCKIQEGMGL